MSRSEEWPRELRAATDIAGSRLYCACEAGTGRFSTGEAAGTFGTFDSGEDPGLERFFRRPKTPKYLFDTKVVSGVVVETSQKVYFQCCLMILLFP